MINNEEKQKNKKGKNIWSGEFEPMLDTVKLLSKSKP